MTQTNEKPVETYTRYHGVFFYLNLALTLPLVILCLLIIQSLPFVGDTHSAFRKLLAVELVAAALILTTSFLGKMANRVAFLICFTVLLVSQFVTGIATPTDIISGGVERYPVPYLMFAGQPDTRNQNGLGYLGNLPSPNKGDEYRILMLGNSTVKGGGEGSLPSILQQTLRANGSKRSVVYNWGVTSQNSGQEVATILFRAVDYQPDLVILYDGAEVIFPITYDPRPGYPFNFLVYEQGSNQLQNLDWAALTSSLFLKFNLVNGFFRDELQVASFNATLHQLREQANYQSSQWEEQIAESYLKNVDRACHLAKGFGFRLIVFLQPMLVFKPHVTGIESKILDDNRNIEEYVRRQYQRIAVGFAALREQNKDRSCFLVDLSDALNDYPDVAYEHDLIHLNPSANAVMATRLLDEMKTLNLIPLDS